MEQDYREGWELEALDIFREGNRLGASDIHVKAGSPPKFRINNDLVSMENVGVLTPDDTQNLCYRIMDEQNQAKQNNTYDYDYSLELPELRARYRVHIGSTRGSLSFVARKIQDTPRTLDSLGVPEIVKNLALLNNGVIIVTGPTGSGKSSTLAGIIDYINENRSLNIISVENPIEILHTDKQSSVSQREIGVDVENFELALKASLRQDPDVIVVGEIRDLETMKTVLLAADTGHLVITTLHTIDAVEAVTRIVNMYPTAQQKEIRRVLTSSLRGVIAQRLAPAIGGGRVAVNEIMINNDEISEALMNEDGRSKALKTIIEKSNRYGMQTFEQALNKLVQENKITLETAKQVSDKPDMFESDLLHTAEQKISVLPTSGAKTVVLTKDTPHLPPHNNPVVTKPEQPHRGNFPKLPKRSH